MTDTPVRRFEMKASACGYDDLLDNAGYSITPLSHKSYRLWRKGARKARVIYQTELTKLVDDLRLALGLEPIRKK